MRALKLVMAMSLDGFVSDSDNDNRWIFTGDQAAVAWKVETVADAGLHVMGSRTFRSMAGFWPTAASPFAAPMNAVPKAVFSKQGPAILVAATPATPAADDPTVQAAVRSWAEAYVAGGDLAEEVAKLKAQDGKPIVAHGGATFARSLIAHDLVDEYALLVYPLALGQGAPIFSELGAPRSLKLISSTPFPGGVTAQVYRRA